MSQLVVRGDLPIRWTAISNIHVTLKFLGDVEEKLLPRLNDRLAITLSNFHPFQIRIGELGAFPRVERARILWVGCDMDTEGFKVQEAIEETTVRLGFPKEEHPFNPHLTLGRVTNAATSQDYPRIERLISETKADQLGTQIVNIIRIYRSDLSSNAPKYQVLYDLPLGK